LARFDLVGTDGDRHPELLSSYDPFEKARRDTRPKKRPTLSYVSALHFGRPLLRTTFSLSAQKCSEERLTLARQHLEDRFVVLRRNVPATS
jgi:hypothetical protein